MSSVLVAGAVVKCSHGGQRKLPSGDSRLEISSKPAVTAGMETGLTFAPGDPNVMAPCPLQNQNPPTPCTATLAASSGVSSLLDIGGAGVLLDTASGPTTNAKDPSAQWSVVSAGQTICEVAR